MAGPLTKAGRYQIVSELGRGSMGVVYQGFDPLIGRTVAIKTMLIEGLSAAEFNEYKTRFQREAQAAGILTHPNIVTVYDFGEDAGVLYQAMEFLQGQSLQHLIDKQTVLPIETITPIFDQVCSALDHAHSHQIVHRDIKPANIMILDSGLVKVTDFGIAKIMSMGMTQAGQILGTPNYMSPEQVKGRPVDGRSDIFSLGVILYELVTGEKPFSGQNITTVIYKIINENPIPPRELDASIHPGLSFVIQKALAKNCEERFQTCHELAEGLRNYRNLVVEEVPSATVVLRAAPPIAAAPAQPPVTPTRQVAPPPAAIAPAPAVEAPRPRPAAPPAPAPREARPAPRPAPALAPAVAAPAQKSSVAIWILFSILLLVGVGGGGYYFLFVRSQTDLPGLGSLSQPPATSQSAQVQTPAQQAPATQQPAQTTETTPGTTEQQPAGQSTAPATSQPATGEVAAQPSTTSTPAPAPAAPKFGSLLITSTPPGAQFTVDGRRESDWVTPYTVEPLLAGSHRISLVLPGYEKTEKKGDVVAGRTSEMSFTLTAVTARGAAHKPAPAAGQETPSADPSTPPHPVTAAEREAGILTVQTSPPGLEVVIDGKSVGKSPVTQKLPPGDHTFAIKDNGVEVYSDHVTLVAGEAKIKIFREQ